MAEPEKFHVGMIDFFSILLPGAVLTYTLLKLAVQQQVDIGFTSPKTEAEGWVVFLISAYVLGHFIFLVGSVLDNAYDKLLDWQRKHLDEEKRNALALKLPDKWVERLKLRDKFLPLDCARESKKQHTTQASIPDNAINTFQWAKCRLALESPLGLSHVQRFEADSKFFRSFTVVAFILIVLFVITGFCGIATLCAMLMFLSFWRYCDQRYKSTRQAYWYLITLESRLGCTPCTINRTETQRINGCE